MIEQTRANDDEDEEENESFKFVVPPNREIKEVRDRYRNIYLFERIRIVYVEFNCRICIKSENEVSPSISPCGSTSD